MLETVDAKLTSHGVNMIKTSDLGIAEEYGVDEVVPEIVYFENGIPSLYPGEWNICLKKYEPIFVLKFKSSKDTYV